MSVVINTNSAATMAATNLAESSTQLRKSLNRLSTGSRIVSPEDDAGGLAVSMKLGSAVHRSAAVASTIGNATSFLQTQDGVLGVLGKVLSRIGELKTLYMDPTKNSSDLANYDQEFGQLKSQITSLAAEKFNGISLFGSSGLTVAVDESHTNSVSMAAVNVLGGSAVAWSNISGISPGSDWTASDPFIGPFGPYTAMHADGTLTSTQSNISGPYAMNFTFLGLYGGSGQVSMSGGGSGTLNFAAISGAMDFSDHTMSINVDASGTATWSMDSGAQTGSVANFGSTAGGAIQFTLSNSVGNDLHIKNDFTLTSTGGGPSGNIASVSSASSLGALSVSAIGSALQDVATYRATNGAQQSRLGFATEVLTTNKANLEAANSRITDVDVAEESTQLARYNVLTQAGTAMLSQANQSTQVALKLLG